MPFRKARRLGLMVAAFENWPVLIWHRFGLPSSAREVRYRLCGGGGFVMAPGRDDALVLSEVWLGRPYEAVAAFAVQDGWKVIDCGAHKGVFTVGAAIKGPQVFVWAVEPEPANLAALRANVASIAPAQVEVIAAAVTSRSGEGHLELKHSPGHTLIEHAIEGRTVPVRLVELASLIATTGPPIDLLKLDIEGAEYEIFGRLAPGGLVGVRRLIVKCHARDGRSSREGASSIEATLVSHGFECVYIASSQMIFARGASLADAR